MQYVKLNNGVEIPQLGLGVFMAKNGEETKNAVKWAIEAGYRHIDTAATYGNEESVGEGIKESGIDRRELFITTKMWVDKIYQGKFEEALEESLKKLQTDYLDLYLLHWPVTKEANIAAWKAMEKFVKEGKVRAIGLSNFNVDQLKEILEICEIKPAVDQVELHPTFDEHEIVAFCREQGIDIEAWSPLGGFAAQGSVLNDPTIGKIAEKYGRTPAQVIVRWDLQNGVIVIPKSVHKERIVSNFDVFGFELADEDMKTISALNKENRMGPHPVTFWENYKAKNNL